MQRHSDTIFVPPLSHSIWDFLPKKHFQEIHTNQTVKSKRMTSETVTLEFCSHVNGGHTRSSSIVLQNILRVPSTFIHAKTPGITRIWNHCGLCLLCAQLKRNSDDRNCHPSLRAHASVELVHSTKSTSKDSPQDLATH